MEKKFLPRHQSLYHCKGVNSENDQNKEIIMKIVTILPGDVID